MTEFDVLILGSGVAGLSAAVHAAGRGLTVALITKARIEQATTRWAQGGVAAALSGNPEEIDLHLADTLAAGAGLCDVAAVRLLVDQGPRRVHELMDLGAVFDRGPDHRLELAREGGHSVPRIVHAGGSATGAEVERALIAAAQVRGVDVREGCFALDLVVRHRRCSGVVVLDDGEVSELAARQVLMATGGAGQLFALTTNPPVATGDGVAMALRAGVAVADLEFFQFHPTALAVDSMPRPLLTEALRGHGALLLDTRLERFVDELKPRDVVSRAMQITMSAQGVDHLWLDARGLDHFADRFPNIAADLARVGLDPATDLLPVAPAAHHQCGGVVVDLQGATSLPGLWAVGETSCTGVHGANRLASNSLLEGLVFGGLAIDAICEGADGPEATGAMRCVLDGRASGEGGQGGVASPERGPAVVPGRPLGSFHSPTGRGVPRQNPDRSSRTAANGDGAASAAEHPKPDWHTAALVGELQELMTAGAGVARSAESMSEAATALGAVAAKLGTPVTQADHELANLLDVGACLLWAAQTREETRGAHSRSDFPDRSDRFVCRLVVGGPEGGVA